MHMLVVEDDCALGQMLEEGLKMDGRTVALVQDGEAAIQHAERRRLDLMILDLSLPRMDGLEVLGAMRSRFRWTSVLVLTGRGEMEEKLRCLRLGADDVIVKPFSFRELAARCDAILRRREEFADPMLGQGNIEMDRLRRTVTQAGLPVELTGTEFCLLESLLRRRGRCCSRAQLMEEVWPLPPGSRRRASGSNILEVYVTYLRKKLGMMRGVVAADGLVIRTVRGEGYRLCAAGSGGEMDERDSANAGLDGRRAEDQVGPTVQVAELRGEEECAHG